MSKRAVRIVFLSCLFAIGLFASRLQVIDSAAPPVPPNFEDVAIATVAAPTSVAFAPDGRLRISTQSGQLGI
jgi:hypothetical protein